MVPAMARVLCSATGPRITSIRSTWSGDNESIEKPAGARSPFSKTWV